MENEAKKLPWWAWIFPILFGLLGGLIPWICFRKRPKAGWLLAVGLVVQIISNTLIF